MTTATFERNTVGTVITAIYLSWILFPVFLLFLVLVSSAIAYFSENIKVFVPCKYIELFSQPSILLHLNAWTYFADILIRLVYGLVLLAGLLVPEGLLGVKVSGWLYCLVELGLHAVAFWKSDFNNEAEYYPIISSLTLRFLNNCYDDDDAVDDPNLTVSKKVVYGLCSFVIIFIAYPVLVSIDPLKGAFQPFVEVHGEEDEAALELENSSKGARV